MRRGWCGLAASVTGLAAHLGRIEASDFGDAADDGAGNAVGSRRRRDSRALLAKGDRRLEHAHLRAHTRIRPRLDSLGSLACWIRPCLDSRVLSLRRTSVPPQDHRAHRIAASAT